MIETSDSAVPDGAPDAPGTTSASDGAPDAPGTTSASDGAPDAPAPSSRLKLIVESLVLAADAPLTVGQLQEITGEGEAAPVRAALHALREDYAGRGIQLVEVGGGWQLRTHPDHAPFVQRLHARRPVPLSRAARETLAIVAYRQPVTRAEVEEIRGVDCSGVLKLLLDRELVRTHGHREEPGRPLLYVTTRPFLELFGLRDLRDLPTLREFTELSEESRAKLERLTGEAGPIPTEAAAADEPRLAEDEIPPEDASLAGGGGDDGDGAAPARAAAGKRPARSEAPAASP